MIEKTEKLAPLTVDILRRLKFKMVMRTDGDKLTTSADRNDEYGLDLCGRTNGRPKYTYTTRELQAFDGDIVADLLSPDRNGEMERFCKAYNERAGL